MALFVKLLVSVILKFHITVIYNLCGYTIYSGNFIYCMVFQIFLESTGGCHRKDKMTRLPHMYLHIIKDNENKHYLCLIFQKGAHFDL